MSATLVLTSVLLLSGEADERSAVPQARALMDELPGDLHQRVGRGAQLLAVLRARPDILRGLIDGGALARWPTLAALADAGGTVDELLSMLPAPRIREVR